MSPEINKDTFGFQTKTQGTSGLGDSDEDHHSMAGPVCFGVSQDPSITADC